jgi:hypothetical protein
MGIPSTQDVFGGNKKERLKINNDFQPFSVCLSVLLHNPHVVLFHPPMNLQKICKDLRHTHELTVPRLFQIIGMLGKVTQAVKIKHILERTSLLHCLQKQRHHTVKVGRTERARIRTLFSPCNTLRQNIAERFAQDALFPAVQTL